MQVSEFTKVSIVSSSTVEEAELILACLVYAQGMGGPQTGHEFKVMLSGIIAKYGSAGITLHGEKRCG